MLFSLDLIRSVNEADTLINMAQRDKRSLANRRETLLIRSRDGAEGTTELAATLSNYRAQLAASIAGLEGMPEGLAKEDALTHKMELEVKVRKLSRPGGSRSAENVLEQEYDAEQLDKQIAGADAFTDLIEAHKLNL
ncbi:MAG: hypothetical protein ABIX01_10025 [Chitinophagaceae bacterium]